MSKKQIVLYFQKIKRNDNLWEVCIKNNQNNFFIALKAQDLHLTSSITILAHVQILESYVLGVIRSAKLVLSEPYTIRCDYHDTYSAECEIVRVLGDLFTPVEIITQIPLHTEEIKRLQDLFSRAIVSLGKRR